MKKLINKESVLKVAKGFTFTDKVEEKMYMDFLKYCLDNVETLDSNKKVSPIKWKLLRYVESCSDYSSDLDIIKMYVGAFPASLLNNLINDLQHTQEEIERVVKMMEECE